MQAIESGKTTIGTTISELPTCDFTVDADAKTESVKEAFDRRADLAGAIVMDGDQILEVISRDSLFRHLSRAFFREIFLKRPIRAFVKMWCGDILRLEATCTINRAAELALARPHERTFEPILVDYGGRVGLLDTQVLLVAQAQLLSLSRLIEEQRDAAEAANRSKSEFLANMSHELRTPMTAILGFADVLLEHPSENLVVESGQIIKRNGEYLLNLINDILDLAKIEASKRSIERVVCSPLQMAADTISLMKVRADAKRLPLTLDVRENLPERIITDPTCLRQILVNLIGNAIKFTEVGSVRVVARMDTSSDGDAWLRIDVSDTGIGMSKEQIAQLFQPFSQVDASAHRRFGGTGLGLAISKRLAEMLGGDISVTSDLGSGSTFSVCIAAGQPDGARLVENPSGKIADRQSPAAGGQRNLNCRILLAEDCPDNQRLIALVLRKAEAEVVMAENGKITIDLALAALQAGSPFDAILMDMQMPVMDGYEATKKLRDVGYNRPIIALTANAMVGDRQACLDAGCDDYIVKPIDQNQLLETVAKHVNGRPDFRVRQNDPRLGQIAPAR